MSGVRQIVCFAALIFLCLVAAAATARAAGSSATSVPGNLRAQVLKLGIVCSHHRRALNHQDCLMVSRSKQKLFAQLYLESRRLCQSLRPSPRDGAVGTIAIERRKRHTRFTCTWGRLNSPRRAKVMVDLPKPGQILTGRTCDSYVGLICTQLTEGIQVTRPYDAVTKNGSLLLVNTRGYVEVTRWETSASAFNAYLAADLYLFNRIASSLGLPREGE
jgi:hypothetical protein